MHLRKNMIQSNEGFVCQKCKIKIPPHQGGSCRNHCSFCLYSLHVDESVPGDRASLCQGLMAPIAVEINKKKGVRILHLCQKCGHRIWNRSAPDDNWELVCQLSRVPR